MGLVSILGFLVFALLVVGLPGFIVAWPASRWERRWKILAFVPGILPLAVLSDACFDLTPLAHERLGFELLTMVLLWMALVAFLAGLRRMTQAATVRTSRRT